ncbi:hypothetical protein ACW9KT_03140 [Hymenobacter sp. HD11105]
MPLPPIEPAVAALLQQLSAPDALPPTVAGLPPRLLSIHDHRLSEEEAASASISFPTLASLQDYRFYRSEEDKFITLLAALFRTTEVVSYQLPPSAPAQPLETWPHLIALTTAGLREQQPFVFYIRRYHLLLASAPALTVSVYFLEPRHEAAFGELARAYGLYLV